MRCHFVIDPFCPGVLIKCGRGVLRCVLSFWLGPFRYPFGPGVLIKYYQFAYYLGYMLKGEFAGSVVVCPFVIYLSGRAPFVIY